MRVPRNSVVSLKSYESQAEVLIKNYLLASPFIPYTSILGSMLACKLVYNFSQLFSTLYFESYSSLTKIQRIEWNNRAISTAHALFIGLFSLYFVFYSDLFSDQQHTGLITFRSSEMSTFALGFTTLPSSRLTLSGNPTLMAYCRAWTMLAIFGIWVEIEVSVGYFIGDLGHIIWRYPSLGGVEYIVHHSLSTTAVSYSMFTGQGQFYTFMSLISEITTPEINLRWYLDTAGLKRSIAYLINGVVIVFSWLVARILLFVYMFYHVYLHYDQVHQMDTIGFLMVFIVPSALGTMNIVWFGKILKGLKKTLAKEALI